MCIKNRLSGENCVPIQVRQSRIFDCELLSFLSRFFYTHNKKQGSLLFFFFFFFFFFCLFFFFFFFCFCCCCYCFSIHDTDKTTRRLFCKMIKYPFSRHNYYDTFTYSWFKSRPEKTYLVEFAGSDNFTSARQLTLSLYKWHSLSLMHSLLKTRYAQIMCVRAIKPLGV